MWGIIGGSGFERSEVVSTVEELDRETPFGLCSSGLKRVLLGRTSAIFLPRHGSQHELSPSEVNFRANIFALKKYGVRRLLALSAVGSLRQELKPGDLVVPKQFIDRTKGLRTASFCGQGVVGHVSLAHPSCPACTSALQKLARRFSFPAHFGKTAVCIEGPYFSTQAESHAYRDSGADIIGMTSFPEYGLAREAGLCYLPCFFVTDYDCWDDAIPHVTVAEVMEVMRSNNGKAFHLIAEVLLAKGLEECGCAAGGLKNSLMTPWERVPQEIQSWMRVLIG